jgi:hypothetical protein
MKCGDRELNKLMKRMDEKQLHKQFKKVVMTELCLSESGKMRKQFMRDVANMPEENYVTDEQQPTQTCFN